jgi:hypothetical protein
MRKYYLILILFGCVLFTPFSKILAQEDEERIVYYQMEPLDDSLFLKIQTEVYIDPPDPKAEIIIDLRDPNNQTLSIKGTLYPFLALKSETRARIITYPFKINLEEQVNYGSLFTRIVAKMKIGKLFEPPTLTQISSTKGYINPFFQLQGGERYGISLRSDVGFSFGIGTPYSGVLETNFMEANFHILGFFIGLYSSVDAAISVKGTNNNNNLYVTDGFQLGYVIPLGNFFMVSFTRGASNPDSMQLKKWDENVSDFSKIKIIDKSYINWEFRYPIKVLGSTRGKFYVGQYFGETHIGYAGRELSLAGSTFDLRFDAMVNSDVRRPQYVIDIMAQKIFETWGFSSFAMGPSIILSDTDDGTFGVTSLFANIRLKVGTSF